MMKTPEKMTGEKRDPTPLLNEMSEIFGDNPALVLAGPIVEVFMSYVYDYAVLDHLASLGFFTPHYDSNPTIRAIQIKGDIEMAKFLFENDRLKFLYALGSDFQSTYGLRSTILRHLVSNELREKPPRSLHMRGASEKLLNLGLPSGYFAPQKISRVTMDKPMYKDLLGVPVDRAKRVLNLIQKGPNIDFEMDMVHFPLLHVLERHIQMEINKLNQLDSTHEIHPLYFELKQVTRSDDPRGSVLVEIYSEKPDGDMSKYPDLVLSFNWTDKYWPTGDERQIHKIDGRNSEKYYPGNYRSKVVRHKGQFYRVPIKPTTEEGDLNLFENELVSQTFTQMTRLTLDLCAGHELKILAENGETIEPVTFEMLLQGTAMWDEFYPYMSESFYYFYDEIPDNWDDFNFDKFRGDEYVSRLMVAYGLDPYMFVVSAHAIGLLEHLPLHGYISEQGGIDTWAQNCINAQNIETHGQDLTTAEKLKLLSDNFKAIRDSLTPEEYPWFTTKYILPEDPFEQDWNDTIVNITPWFMDHCARKPQWFENVSY